MSRSSTYDSRVTPDDHDSSEGYRDKLKLETLVRIADALESIVLELSKIGGND